MEKLPNSRFKAYLFFSIPLLVGLLVYLFIGSCKKDKYPVQPLFYEYFPTAQGTYVIYNVDSIVHADNDNNTDDSIYYYHYQLKDVVDSSFVDLSGRTRQIVERYYRPDTASAWNVRNVYSQWLSATAAYFWEDNIAYHKLSFPITDAQEWNWNDMNTSDELIFTYLDIHTSKTLNGLAFDSTVTASQRDEDDNIVDKNFDEEIYANHIGMVYKQSDHLLKNVGHVVSGTQYRMTVAGYGRE